MKKTAILAFLLLCAVASGISTQTKKPQVDAREKIQQERIKEGVKSGELTPGETRKLEAQEGKIKADEINAKADGKVTPGERRHLKKELNRESRRIHRAKHNDRTRNN